MTVYVESNFVLEQALQQEEHDSCSEIIDLASNNRIALVIPAFSLAEPHEVISGKEKARSRLSNDLRTHLNELGRSKRHRDLPASFDVLAATLMESAQLERDGLRRTVSELLACAEIVPLEASILKSAADLQLEYGMSGQDSIVLASVLAHLESRTPAESCFLNRNSKDFGQPDIREKLEGRACRFFARFGLGSRYILSRI